MHGDDHEVQMTPDGRYIVVRERLWRATNPTLTEEERQSLVNDLMNGRRAVARAKQSDDAEALAKARALVHSAKVGLGERGAVWWTDGAPDYNKHKVRSTPYVDWWEQDRAGA
jgi:hypothetical protein